MTTLITALLVVIGAIALLMKDLLNAVICLAVFSLLCALLFYYLHAPDVAIAEAAVVAGISTVLFVWAIRETVRSKKDP